MSTNRVRERGEFKMSPHVISEYFKWQNCSQTDWALNTTLNSLCVGSKELMHDVVTPGFKVKSLRGIYTFNSLFHQVRTSDIDSIGSGFILKSQSPGNICSGVERKFEIMQDGPLFARWIRPNEIDPLDVVRIFSDAEIYELQKEVSTKVHAKRGNSDSNLFESLAEYRQTIQLLKSPLKGFHRFLTKNESAIKKANKVGSAWLTYRYGVRPLIKDVQGIIEGMKQKVGRMRITTRAQQEIRGSAQEQRTFGPLSGYNMTYGIQKTEHVMVRGMSFDEYVVDRAERLGFTAKGLLTVPWELVPYSFVADWFVNFGDFLQAIIPLPGVKTLGSCITTRIATSNIWSPLLSYRTGYDMTRGISGQCSSTLTTKTRGPLLLPSIVVKSDFKLDDAVRLADSLSLIGQRMGSLFSRR